MYYGPNYDASSAGVSPAASTSPSASSPDQPTDKALYESVQPHDHDHDRVEEDDHRNADNCVEHHDPHDHFDNHDCGDLDQEDDPDQGDVEEEDNDDDDDWITPDNLHRAREQMGGATTVSAKGVAVGCLTTDFSMQV